MRYAPYDMTDAITAARPGAASGRRGVMVALCAAFVVYSAYVYTTGTAAPGGRAFSPEVKAGLALFQEKNCIACHQFYGLGGYMGPDLTNVVSAPDKGAAYARAFLESGTAKMPDFHLSAAEIDDLIQFLAFVDSTGVYPPRQPEISWTGTVAYHAARDPK